MTSKKRPVTIVAAGAEFDDDDDDDPFYFGADDDDEPVAFGEVPVRVSGRSTNDGGAWRNEEDLEGCSEEMFYPQRRRPVYGAITDISHPWAFETTSSDTSDTLAPKNFTVNLRESVGLVSESEPVDHNPDKDFKDFLRTFAAGTAYDRLHGQGFTLPDVVGMTNQNLMDVGFAGLENLVLLRKLCAGTQTLRNYEWITPVSVMAVEGLVDNARNLRLEASRNPDDDAEGRLNAARNMKKEAGRKLGSVREQVTSAGSWMKLLLPSLNFMKNLLFYAKSEDIYVEDLEETRINALKVLKVTEDLQHRLERLRKRLVKSEIGLKRPGIVALSTQECYTDNVTTRRSGGRG